MDRPLLKIDDYIRFKGRYVKLHLKTGLTDIDTRKVFKGYIKDVLEQNIVIESNIDDDVKLLNIPYSNILKCKLLITDDILRQILKDSKKKGKNKNV